MGEETLDYQAMWEALQSFTTMVKERDEAREDLRGSDHWRLNYKGALEEIRELIRSTPPGSLTEADRAVIMNIINETLPAEDPNETTE